MSRSVLWFMMVNGLLDEKIILPNFEMTIAYSLAHYSEMVIFQNIGLEVALTFSNFL